jgi:hypothetical protein
MSLKKKAKINRYNQFVWVCATACVVTACQGQGRRARLESYRSLALQQKAQLNVDSPKNNEPLTTINAKISAASTTLSREDLLPCESLPPRKLTHANGRVLWLDGSWAKQARVYLVKGPAESNFCQLEIRPWGHVNINPGGKDAFIRGRQIHLLLTNPDGDTYIPPNEGGRVHCNEYESRFRVTAGKTVLGSSPISYVANEGVPLMLAPRVCLARLLSAEQIPQNEWALLIPAINFNIGLQR